MKLPTTFFSRLTQTAVLLGALSTFQAKAQTGPALVEWLKFDGNTTDSSPYSNNGTASGGTFFVAGKIGSGSIKLDGTSGIVQLPATVANRAAVTIACWVNWDGGAPFQRIFDFGNGTSQGMFLTPSSGTGEMRFAIFNGGPGQDLNVPGLPSGVWKFVTVTLGNTNGSTIYVDGQSVGQLASTIRPNDFNPATNYLGKSAFGDANFAGRIDDFRIYNYEMTAAQVTALMAQTLPTLPAALAQQVSVYPNPATARVELTLPALLTHEAVPASLLDALGRQVRSLTVPAQGTTASVDLRGLPAGIYTLRLSTSAGTVAKRLTVE